MLAYSGASGIGVDVRFNGPSDMLPIGDRRYVITDTHNSCLRILNRTTLAVNDYTGTCLNKGNADGPVAVAQFVSPTGLIYDQTNNLLYVIDGLERSSLRVIDIHLSEVKTKSNFALSLSYGVSAGKFLVISYDHGIVIVDTQNDFAEVNRIGRVNDSGSIGGWFSKSLFSQPHAVALVDNLVAFVADTDNHDVRVADFSRKKVSSLCSLGETGNVDGSIAGECHMCLPWGIVAVNDTLYVGEGACSDGGGGVRIRSTSIKGVNC